MGQPDTKERILEARPELIMLDLNMPGFNGHELCRSIKREPELSKIPVVFLTCENSESSRITAYKEGAVHYINKEQSPLEISEIVKSLVESYGPEAEKLIFNEGNEIQFGSETIKLSPEQFKIAEKILSNLERKVFKEDLLELLGKEVVKKNFAILETQISTIRKKIEIIPFEITTIYGEGYMGKKKPNSL